MAKKDGAEPAVDAQPGSVDEASQGKKKKGLFWIILIPAVLLTMAAGGFLAYSQYPRLHGAAAAKSAEKQKEEKKKEEAGSSEEYGVFTEIPDLVVNPTGTDGQRFLLISIGIESKEQPVLDEVKEKDIVVRDAIINALAHQPVIRLSDIRERDKIKEELRGRINRLLHSGKVTRLYFTQYVLQ